MNQCVNKASLPKRSLGWLVHAFTASGACVGILSLLAVYEGKLMLALWLMSGAIMIDAVDGTFARMVKIKDVVPEIDGALLDNIVDYVNYTIVPCFILLVTEILPPHWRIFCVVAIIFASSYQFTQHEAKTEDHFFKGFPSYWNIAVMYLFFLQMSQLANILILLTLAVMSFVPIKYVYPSRLDYLTNNKYLRLSIVFLTCMWGVATTGLLWLYPQSNSLLVGISMGYMLVYMGISLYRTFFPLDVRIIADHAA